MRIVAVENLMEVQTFDRPGLSIATFFQPPGRAWNSITKLGREFP
jgi:hypothetical protein